MSFQIVPQTRTSRVTRRPQHTFNITVIPYEITPCFIAPVLPGETMKNMLFQARVVTQPIKDPLVGWWCEFYFFYVKHRDLAERDTLTQMMINPAVTAPTSAVHGFTFNFANGVNWVEMCLKRITECYFRDTGEAWDVAKGGYYPLAQIQQQTVLDSALLETAYDVGQAASTITVGADDQVTGQELSAAYMTWQQYRMSNVTGLSYEEYLHTYGIPLPQGSDGEHRPELVRYVKDWSYPTNTVDPATGAPSSAVSWAVAERADKDRFFREPGFLFGVSVIRPKSYLGNQGGSVAGLMKDALSWLPAVLGDNPEYSMRAVPAATGPFSGVTTGYRLDIKDLFLYGEQYTNRVGALDPWPKVSNAVQVPTATMQKKFPASSDITAMFKDATKPYVALDGVVSLNILGNQIETTPTRAPGTF